MTAAWRRDWAVAVDKTQTSNVARLGAHEACSWARQPCWDFTNGGTRVRQLRLASVCSADVAAKWDERLAASGPAPAELDTRCGLCVIALCRSLVASINMKLCWRICRH